MGQKATFEGVVDQQTSRTCKAYVSPHTVALTVLEPGHSIKKATSHLSSIDDAGRRLGILLDNDTKEA